MKVGVRPSQFRHENSNSDCELRITEWGFEGFYSNWVLLLDCQPSAVLSGFFGAILRLSPLGIRN